MAREYEGIPRRWAAYNEGTAGPRAKSSGEGKRVSFSGRVFYSYQTPVAVYYSNARGEKCVLIKDRKWSVSTAQHLSAATGSTGLETNVFRVNTIGAYGGWKNWADLEGEALHVHNAQHLLTKARNLAAGYKRCWRRADTSYDGGSWITSMIETAYNNVSDYCAFWDIDLPKDYEPGFEVVQRLREGWLAQKTKYEDPKAVAKRTRARARRLAKQILCGEDA